jgi:hypothetical protein
VTQGLRQIKKNGAAKRSLKRAALNSRSRKRDLRWPRVVGIIEASKVL